MLTSVFSFANTVSKAGSGAQALASLTGYLDNVMAWVAGAAAKVPTSALVTGGAVVTAGTVVTIGSSVMQGQEAGGIVGFGKGFLDVGTEDYYDKGADQSGTTAESVGNLVQGLGISAYAALVSTGKLAELLGPKAKYIGLITKALFAWQASTLADEALRGDGDPYKDKLDMAGNVLSLISLAALGAKGSPVFPGKLGGGGLCGFGIRPLPINPSCTRAVVAGFSTLNNSQAAGQAMKTTASLLSLGA